RDAAQAPGVPGGDPRRRHVRPHRRRPRRPLVAARAVHRRGHRHEDPGGAMTVERLHGQHLLNTYARYDTEFVRGEGWRLWDADGNEYLDFLSGISVSSVGHCHPKVVEAISSQAGRLIHVGNLYFTDPMARLADRLAGLSLGGGVFFTNSGAE